MNLMIICILIILTNVYIYMYRLENEQLNNAGKFRAVKAVPLPFSEMVSDG